MLEAVIFDFDGVILDSEPLHYEACSKILRTYGIFFTYQEYIEKYLGLSDKDMFPNLFEDQGKSFSLTEINVLIAQKAQAYIDIIQNHENIPLMTGFEQFLLKIAGIVNEIAICSGSAKHEIMAVLSKVKQGALRDYFTCIVSAEDVQKGKPSPEGYLLTSKRLNISPDHCLVIEDTPHGVQAAKDAGMHVIALTTTYNEDRFCKADLVISSFEQLLQEQFIEQLIICP